MNTEPSEHFETPSSRIGQAPTFKRAPQTPKPLLPKRTQSMTKGASKSISHEIASRARSNQNPTPLKAARNSLIGMALVYAERVESLFSPVIFLGRNMGSVIAAFLHVFLPLIAAFAISHWNDTIQTNFWSGGIIGQCINFSGLWLLCLLSWSMIWMTLTAVSRSSYELLHGFNDTGAKHFDHS